MKKGILKTVVSFSVLMCFLATGFAAYAQGDKTVEGVFVNKPSITLIANGSASADDFDGTKVNDCRIDITKTQKYSIDKFSVAIYVALDVSGSMGADGEDYLAPIKECLKTLASTLGDDDELVLYEVGTQPTLKLRGTEDKQVIESTIDSLQCGSNAKQNPSVYNALGAIYTDATADFMFQRKLVLCITDGSFKNVGGIAEKTAKTYSTHSLPVYALIPDSVSSADESLAYFQQSVVASSGGTSRMYNSVTAESAFGEIKAAIDNVTVVEGKFSDNTSYYSQDGGEYTLTCGKTTIKNIQMRTDDTDVEAPEITGNIVYNKSKNVFVITFNKKIRLSSADKIAVTKNGRDIPLDSISTKGKKLYIGASNITRGEYTFALEGVVSDNINLTPCSPPSVTQAVEAPVGADSLHTLWLAALALAFVLFCIALVMIKRKNNAVTGGAETKHLSMRIEAAGKTLQADFDMDAPVFVGRSLQCDVCIEDIRLSKKHFKLDVIGDSLEITDLNSSNGTFVNGSRVMSQQIIKAGDCISAGGSKIIILQ